VAGAQARAAHRAVLLVAADTGEVLVAEQANLASRPASLTKLMTVYLTLEAIEESRFGFDTVLQVSDHARAQAPRRLGLKTGAEVPLRDVLLAIVVRSANDAAVVAAEAVAGSEGAFVELMNAKATELGMVETRFRNASGLPDPRQVTTARDMAVLALALKRDFPQHYPLLATRSFEFRGRRYDHNSSTIRQYQGVNGFKTGFTCRAGYNLVASVDRDDRRLIGVVLGSSTPWRRDKRMVELLDAGFDGVAAPSAQTLVDLKSQPEQGSGAPVNSDFIAAECINPRRSRDIQEVSGWSLEFGVVYEKKKALTIARAFIRDNRKTLKGGRPLLIPRLTRRIIYRVGVTDLKQANAAATCLKLRETGEHCVVLMPEAARLAMKQAKRAVEFAKQQDKP